jgi:hypothetical protein
MELRRWQREQTRRLLTVDSLGIVHFHYKTLSETVSINVLKSLPESYII